MIKLIKRFFDPRLIGKERRIGKGKKEIIFYNPPSKKSFVFGIGSALVIGSIAYLVFLYTPLAKAFYNYKWGPSEDETAQQFEKFIDEEKEFDYSDFYIYVPKIKASARIFPNVSTIEKEEYMRVLADGVAHAKGTGFPGHNQLIYLFAHSTDTPFNAVRMNAVFMLLNELKENDPIIIFFNGEKHIYNVYDKKIVNPEDVEYLFYPFDGEILILQTCWPPGTTWKRLIVVGHKQIH